MMSHNERKWLDVLPGIVFIKDTHNKYKYLNEHTANLFGYRKPESFLEAGAVIECIKGKVSEYTVEIKKEEDYIIGSQQSLRILSLYGFDMWRVILGEKKPIFDESHKVTGTICCSQDVTNSNIINSYQLVCAADRKFHANKNISYYITKDYKPLSLTARQTECLYYLVRGYSANDIAKVLNLSKRTIEFHMNEIKHVMSCQNRAEVIDKAIHSGFLNIIPQSLLAV